MRVLVALLLVALLGGCAAGSGSSGNSGNSGNSGAASRTGARIRGRSTRYTVESQPPAGSCHTRGHGLFSLPDPSCTPGTTDRRVTQAGIDSTICRRGYTRRVRPPLSITRREKRASMRAYGLSGSSRGYEYDHLIPLELGGAPNDRRNLWPEPGATPNPKDRVERALNHAVCRHQIRLRTAQHEIASSWVAVYRRLFG